MHPLADGMLLGMLDTHDPVLRSEVSVLLQQLQVPQAAPFIAASPASAERETAAALDNYRRGVPVFAADQNNQVELWQWSDATKELSPVRVSANEARIIWMSKLARRLSQLRPENPAYQRQAAVLGWEAASTDPRNSSTGTPANSPFDLHTDMRLLNDMLAEALKENYPHAAIRLLSTIAGRGDPSVLLTIDAKPSPVTEALTSPNRNVRFAALGAIMALDPPSPYPGSSRVPEALAWFAASGAPQRALVAMPTYAAASDLAGQLDVQGLPADATNRGRDAVAMSRDMADLAAIFVDMDIQAPGIREVLYELRTNPTTGEVPIAILAGDGRLEAAQRLAAEHQRVVAVPRPHSPEVVASTVKQLADLAAVDPAADKERAAQAAQAQTWLAKLESGNRPFYTFRRTALLETEPPRRQLPVNRPRQ